MRLCKNMSLHLPVDELRFVFARNAHIAYSMYAEGIVNPSIMHKKRFLFLEVSHYEDIQK